MEHIENDFMQYYSAQLHANTSLPKKITGQFEIVECLVSSETKEIYVLRDKSSGKKFLLRKQSRQNYVLNTAERDILSSLDHPSIPKLLALLEDKDFTYLIREYFEGISLESLVSRDGPCSEKQVISISVQLCDLLTYLHSRTPPIIHRDIKPQNIIIRPDGSVGLIDFDSSRLYNASAAKDTVYLGTRQTAAPEQFGYAQTDKHTDIYSLGILLIYLSTGSYEKSALPALPAWLRKIAAKCTEFNPKDRYSTAAEIKRYLLRKNRIALPIKMLSAACALFLLVTSSTGVYYIVNQINTSVHADSTSNNNVDKSAVVFDNSAVEHAVRAAIGKTGGQPIYESDLGQITSISIVADSQEPVLSGDIQHDYSRQVIKIKNREVKRGTVDSFSDLAKLPFLKDLTLVYQQLTDLSGIEKLHLQALFIGYNQVTDLTPLKDMTTLSSLSIICNPIEDLTPLKGLNHLTYLQICGTGVDDLSPITSLDGLTGLDVTFMSWLDLSQLDRMKNLQHLYK